MIDDALRRFGEAAADVVTTSYGIPPPPVLFAAPRRPEFGDFATTLAFSLAKDARRPPAEVAAAIVAQLTRDHRSLHELFSDITAVGGFINLRVAPRVWHASLAHILHEGEHFGESPRKGIRVSLEFGSANPTGPLVVVQGRSMSIGATLANALRFCGYDVFVEWIINDAGGQLDALGRSIYARYRQLADPSYPFPDDGYPGDYLIDLAREVRERDGDRWMEAAESAWLPQFAKFGRDALVADQQRTALRFGVAYDRWQSEAELHATGAVGEGVERLRQLGLTYEADDALFFRATQFGDDKDRVLLRRDGRPTYFCMDVAYHYQKLKVNDRVVDILGPDHHGYIERLKGLAAALGYPGRLEIAIAQQVALMRGDQQVALSKRAGEIVTLDEILDEVGVDAARFFFIMPAVESPLVFDLGLAVEKANENPVYYVQYGHARIASVLRRASADDVGSASGASLEPLTAATELALMRRLSEFPAVVAGVANDLAPHRLARYARDVASDFHQFYTECKILTDDVPVRRARLALSLATKSVLARTLGLIGVTAPESM
ncbi:MAG: arginine--tRNA ligase [Candidatus Eremiobacteraeota bacterium]|nr:arginine--tRNA ligase [Candidatus Eremiobacteraeota bacterium]MBV9056975.1 arginine--tRNA ligase [Candidatus Eremiobacteraeota bacterium]MBV9698766.1 arginine--tRNA ligase [Candidatus Eremiobacteraeota bacterium]